MKRVLLILLLLAASLTLRAQDHPFQNPALPEEERLDNAVSLMTVDEKLATLVGMGVPRLGIANPFIREILQKEWGMQGTIVDDVAALRLESAVGSDGKIGNFCICDVLDADTPDDAPEFDFVQVFHGD